MLAEKISGWVDDNRQAILGLNRTLVSIPSENRYPSGDEKQIQGVVESLLRERGFRTDVFLPTDVEGITEHSAYLKGRDYTDRPNVVGIRKGSGGRSIILSGHVDTVPLGSQSWSVDPFAGELRGGRQYGLGMFDMKGAIGAAISALRALDEVGVELSGDVIFETVVDEEYGGANGTLACRLRGYEADAAILCEPTQLEICPANQGAVIYRTTFRGKESFLFNEENPLNPTYAGARFLEIVRRYEVHHKEKPSSSKFFKDDPGPPTFVMGVRAGSIKPPFSERAPGECIIDVGIQCYPETSEEELYEDFTNFYFRHARKDAILAQFRPTFDRLIRFLPGSQIPQDHAIIDVVSRSARLVQGHELPIRGAPYASDSFMFNLHSNTPVLIWGPKGGNAHAPDEYIEVEPFMQLVNMYALTIAEWCGGTEYA